MPLSDLKSKSRCHQCKQIGHWSRECPQRQEHDLTFIPELDFTRERHFIHVHRVFHVTTSGDGQLVFDDHLGSSQQSIHAHAAFVRFPRFESGEGDGIG